jgi:hypothetical protein
MNASTSWFFYYAGGAVAPPPPPPPALRAIYTIDVDIEILSPVTDTWISLARDVRTSEVITVEYGIRGASPDNRIADAGSATFALNNAEVLGRYSPLHANCRADFTYNVPVRVSLTYDDGYNPPYTSYKFYGKLGNVQVVPGTQDERMVRCTARDILYDYAKTPVPSLEVVFDRNGGFLVQDIISALPVGLQPTLSVVAEAAPDNIAVAFDTFRGRDMSVKEALHDIARSDFGIFMVIGTATAPGGLPVYRNRQYASRNNLVLFHLTGDLISEMSVPGSREDIVSDVEVTTHPTTTTGEVVIFSMVNSGLLINNGTTYTGFSGRYVSPTDASISIGATQEHQPVPYTDYTINSAQDGLGSDLTGNVTITAEFLGTEAKFTMANGGGTPGYVTFLQLRGVPIYRTEAVTLNQVDPTYGDNVLQIDMPLQSDANIGRSVAEYLSQTLSQPMRRVYSVKFLANRSRSLTALSVIAEPGHRISVSEEMTGLVAEEFIITGVRLEIDTSGPTTPLVWCTWFLEPASAQQFWTLDLAGSSELDQATVLGF